MTDQLGKKKMVLASTRVTTLRFVQRGMSPPTRATMETEGTNTGVPVQAFEAVRTRHFKMMARSTHPFGPMIFMIGRHHLIIDKNLVKSLT